MRSIAVAAVLGAAGLVSGCGAAPQHAAVLDFRAQAERAAEARLALLDRLDGLDEAALATLTGDVDEDVAVAAATALGRHRERRSLAAIEALCRCVDDPRVRVRRIALLSLFNLIHNRPGGFESDDVSLAVLKGIRDADKAIGQFALTAIEYMDDPALLPELTEVMRNSRTSVYTRSHLAWAVLFFRSEHAVPALMECLDVGDYFFIYYHAATSLAAICGTDLDRPTKPRSWEEWQSLYGSEAWRLKTKAFYAAWWERRRAAFLADPLAGLDAPEAVRRAFVRMMADDYGERQAATRDLVALGAVARPFAERAAQASNPRLAAQARKALRDLDGSPRAAPPHRLVVYRPMPEPKGRTRTAAARQPGGPAYPVNPYTFKVRHGGRVVVADLDGDGVTEFLVIGAVRGSAGQRPAITAYGHDGTERWSVEPAVRPAAVPTHPVFALGDSGPPVVVYLREDGVIEMRSGADGSVVRTGGPFEGPAGAPFVPKDGKRPVLEVVNLAGGGRRDLVLAMERTVLTLGPDLAPYWGLLVQTSGGHFLMKTADLDGDGRHEMLLGGTAIACDGRILYTMQAGAHMDDCAAADFLPDRPGHEVMYAQERGADAVILCDTGGLVWELVTGEEPQNLIAGEFVPASRGAEAYCPARGGRRPFIVGGRGRVLVGFGEATNAGAAAPYPLGFDPHLTGADAEAKAERGLVVWAADVNGDGTDELAAQRLDALELVDPVSWRCTARLEGWHVRATQPVQVAGDGRPELVSLAEGVLRVWSAPRRGEAAGPGG